MESVTSYGNLKGASLGVEMESSQNPQNPSPPNSPNMSSPTSSILPKSPTTTTEATSTLIPSNIKGTMMEFCGKNQLTLPKFKRLSPVQGAYSVQLTWSESGSEENHTFIHTTTRPTRKEAECTVASLLLPELKEWINTHKQSDVGNVKGELFLLTTKHSDRFKQPKYTVEPTGLPMFSCTLCVGDIRTGEEYMTSGNGVGKKIAEKVASLEMIQKLYGILMSSPSEEPGMNYLEKIEFRIKQMFPLCTLEFVVAPNNEQPCLLKNFILLLKKENSPDIILSHGSGISEDEAKQVCAQLALPHINGIKELIMPNEGAEVPTI